MTAPGGGSEDTAHFCVPTWLPLSTGMQIQKTPCLSSHLGTGVAIRFKVSPLVVSTDN